MVDIVDRYNARVKKTIGRHNRNILRLDFDIDDKVEALEVQARADVRARNQVAVEEQRHHERECELACSIETSKHNVGREKYLAISGKRITAVEEEAKAALAEAKAEYEALVAEEEVRQRCPCIWLHASCVHQRCVRHRKKPGWYVEHDLREAVCVCVCVCGVCVSASPTCHLGGTALCHSVLKTRRWPSRRT